MLNIKLIKNIKLFETFNDDELNALADHFIQRQYGKNAVIINELDETNSLYIILKGRVKIYLNDESGKEIILDTQSVGDYFGEMSLFDNEPRSASVMTLEDSQFAILNKSDFLHALRDKPELAISIIRGLSLRLRSGNDNVRCLALMDVYGRVVHMLMELSKQQTDGTRIIEEALTYEDLANRVGASSKMISRIMNDLKKGSYLRKEAKKIIIERRLPSAW